MAKKSHVYKNHTLEEYNKKYENRNYKIVDKVDADKTPELLDGRTWWLIKDKYHEVPNKKGVAGFWSNASKAGKIATCALCAGVVGAAVAVPVAIVLSQPSQPSVKVEVNGAATESHRYVDGNLVITLRATGTNKAVTGITKITAGNAELSSSQYSFNKSASTVTITKDVLDKNPGDIVVTPVIEDVTVHVTSIELGCDSINLFVGEETTVSYTILPKNATDKSVKWSSDNPLVASVDEKTGSIKGVAVGGTTVTVTTVDGGKTSKCYVNVIGETQPFTIIGEHNVNAHADYTPFYAKTEAGETVDVSWSLADIPQEYINMVQIDDAGILTVSPDLDIPLSPTIIAIPKGYGTTVLHKIEIASFTKVQFKDSTVMSAENEGEKIASGKLLVPSKYYVNETTGWQYVQSFYYNDETKKGAFEGCELSHIGLPDYSLSVGHFAFKNVIPYGVTNIKVRVPGSISYIDGTAFSYSNDVEFIVDSDNAIYKAYDDNKTLIQTYLHANEIVIVHAYSDANGIKLGDKYDDVNKIDSYALAGNSSKTVLSWPTNLKSIYDRAFAGCTNLATISIPNSVTVINMAAFDGCTNLTEAKFVDTSIWSISDGYTSIESNFQPMKDDASKKKAIDYLKKYNWVRTD